MNTILIIFCVILFFVLGFISILIIWVLAKNDWFFTIIEEGQAKTILVNGAFSKILMSYENKIFAIQDTKTYHVDAELERKFRNSDKINRNKLKEKLRKINQERIKAGYSPVGRISHPWDIVFDKRNLKTSKSLVPYISLTSNIKWIGIPPFSQLYSYRFRWTSIEEKADKEKGQTKKVPYTEDKVINYIYLKVDVFLITVTTAETSELVPLDIKLAITAQVVNPYKALFEAEKWLENIESQVGAKVRKFIGKRKYSDLITAVSTSGQRKKRDSEEHLLSNYNLEYILDSIKNEYGVCVSRVQILDVNPGSKKAEELITASTQKYVKAEKAKGDIKEAEGFKRKYSEISKLRGGPEMYIMEQVKDSKLRAFSSGGQGLISTIKVEDLTTEEKDDKSKEGGEEK